MRSERVRRETWAHRAVHRWYWLMRWAMERGLPVPMARRPAMWVAGRLIEAELRVCIELDAFKRGHKGR